MWRLLDYLELHLLLIFGRSFWHTSVSFMLLFKWKCIPRTRWIWWIWLMEWVKMKRAMEIFHLLSTPLVSWNNSCNLQNMCTHFSIHTLCYCFAHLKHVSFCRSHILPICLPSQPIDLVGKKGIIAGWGKMEANMGHSGTNILQTASVPIISVSHKFSEVSFLHVPLIFSPFFLRCIWLYTMAWEQTDKCRVVRRNVLCWTFGWTSGRLPR